MSSEPHQAPVAEYRWGAEAGPDTPAAPDVDRDTRAVRAMLANTISAAIGVAVAIDPEGMPADPQSLGGFAALIERWRGPGIVTETDIRAAFPSLFGK